MKKIGILIALFVALVGWASTSHSFGFGDIFKVPKVDDIIKVPKTKEVIPEVPKAPEVPSLEVPQAPQVPQVPKVPTLDATPQTETTQQPAAGGGGLIGLGSSLGLLDKRTSKVLQGATQTLQAMKPIGYKEERTIGGALALEVLNRFGGPFHSPPLLKYVNLVGQSLVQVSDRADIPYHFAILNTEDPNAFACPGGYVFISRGLMRLLKNEAQLAGVLGHEIAHITHKHALGVIQRGKAVQGIGQLTTSLMDEDPGKFNQIIGEMSDLMFTRGLDKDLEFEADRVGTEYAYRLGYNPGGLKDFIRLLAGAKPDRSIFFSTHPTPRDRYARMKKFLGKYREAALSPVLTQRYKTQTRGKL